MHSHAGCVCTHVYTHAPTYSQRLSWNKRPAPSPQGVATLRGSPVGSGQSWAPAEPVSLLYPFPSRPPRTRPITAHLPTWVLALLLRTHPELTLTQIRQLLRFLPHLLHVALLFSYLLVCVGQSPSYHFPISPTHPSLCISKKHGRLCFDVLP